jgi:hypothetical protein
MKSFFSIVYLPLRPDLQEKISVGLVMSNNEKNIFKFSEEKLHILKNLFSTNRYNLLKNYFNNLKNEIEPRDEEFKLSLEYNSKSNWINESYFNYLNKYSNNLVVYSEPKKIELDVSIDNFKLLFEKFVFDYEEEVESLKKEDILSKVKTRLYSKIESQVNLNVTVKSKDFNELVTPVDVNFLGKNGVVVSGQTLDFSKRLYNLEHDLTSYISFTKAVDFKEKDKGKYFLVGQEPNKKEHPRNHRTWKHVRESHLVEYVDLSETEKIKEYIFTNQVTPFFKKESISK